MFTQFRLILVAAFAYLVWDMLLRKKKVNDDYEDYINVGKNLTYPEYKYKEFADRLYYAMVNSETEEDWIYSVIRAQKTSADIRKLKEVFGTPNYAGGVFGSFLNFMDPNVSLSGWFQLEGELENVNNILKAKGITERF
jgi:hypothetical protein